MKYLITIPQQPPFLTNWYNFENHFILGMVVYDLHNFTYSTNGKQFNDIPQDHL